MRPANGGCKIIGRYGSELEAGRRIAAVDHCILEAADTGDDGHRAIAERTKLRQPARLEPRRHDQRIRSGLNEMGQFLVITDHDADAAGLGFGRLLKASLQVGITAAEQR